MCGPTQSDTWVNRTDALGTQSVNEDSDVEVKLKAVCSLILFKLLSYNVRNFDTENVENALDVSKTSVEM